jgi:hypothetical protein
MSVRIVTSAAVAHLRQSLFDGPVVMRDQRDNHVRRVLAPMPGERAHLRVMKDADGQVHRRDQLGGAQGPAPPQHDVVDFLERNAGQLADDVDGVQEVLDIAQPRFPGPLLFADDRIESGDGGAMAATRVDVDEVDLWAWHGGGRRTFNRSGR